MFRRRILAARTFRNWAAHAPHAHLVRRQLDEPFRLGADDSTQGLLVP
jgi:hypothetical protein